MNEIQTGPPLSESRMLPSTLSRNLDRELRDFAWDEWAQMGVLAEPRRPSVWSQDPEALIVFTLDVARDDPRLFDELLDWMAVNDGLVSTRRLGAMCEDDEDRRLVKATVGWLAQLRTPAVRETVVASGDLEPLFPRLSSWRGDPDSAFATAGLLRPGVTPSGKASPPDLRVPINFAFRLRRLLGINARSEVVRYLLLARVGPADVAAMTKSARFASRNVREALTSLEDAGVLARRGKRHFEIDRDGWARLLLVPAGELPEYRLWPQLLGSLRRMSRWLRGSELDELSDYMLGSQARDLLEEVRDDFEDAGFKVGRAPAGRAWDDLEALVEEVLATLR